LKSEGVQGAVAIAGGREELFRKKFLSPPCTPLTLQKLFGKGICDRYFVKQIILFAPSLKFLKGWGLGGRETFS